ncbi:peptidylprolyl isomerase [Candidatus Thioglobus sp.]|nr:peptidylprolyl isomerase [Candidatus Thioglobus sp.]
MKRALALLLLFNFQISFADNSILALVNEEIITYNSIEKNLSGVNSYDERLAILNFRINTVLQLKKTQEFDIYPLQSDVNQTIIELANINKVPLEVLRARSDFDLIVQEITEKLSILNLQRFVTKDLKLNLSNNEIINECPSENGEMKIKQIKIAQIIISQIDNPSILLKNMDESIKSFLQKLSEHISKGASFKAFAKLHSQHSSYLNGGETDWIEVDSPTVKMLDSLKKNEVSQIYLTDFGFAIGTKLDERFISNNLKQCKEKLIYLNAEKFYSNWVNGLREDAFIKIYHDAL